MENKQITCAIIGGTGYTAGELLRILLFHPNVEIKAVQSSSNAGALVSAVHRDLIGETELLFCKEIPPVDLLFLCLGHGLSQKFLEAQTLPPHTRVIDLGNDFRPNIDQTAQAWLAHEAPAPSSSVPELFIYGLPEAYREAIRSARRIANPGCFATAIQLGLIPLAAHGLLLDEVHVHALTGSTGAGRGLSDTTHFSYRSNNIALYKPFTHQHLGEIRHTLAQVSAHPERKSPHAAPIRSLDLTNGKVPLPHINFLPLRGDFSRGIFATLYTHCSVPIDKVQSLYQDYYAGHPFVHIVDQSPGLKEAVNTNKCLLHLQKQGDYLLITSVIDNLVKGASGQAVQNMNLMFGWDETMGLRLKPVAF